MLTTLLCVFAVAVVICSGVITTRRMRDLDADASSTGRTTPRN